MSRYLLIAAALLMSLPTFAVAQAPRADAFIEVLLRTMLDAQIAFDARQLDEVFAPDYIEISPRGEVDPRAKVLSFYTPEQKPAAAPAAALDEINTRVYGDTAVTIGRVTYEMKGPDGSTQSRSMRCVFVTRIVDRKWKLVSAQYTPMPK